MLDNIFLISNGINPNTQEAILFQDWFKPFKLNWIILKTNSDPN